jgi:hypothetical protein
MREGSERQRGRERKREREGEWMGDREEVGVRV